MQPENTNIEWDTLSPTEILPVLERLVAEVGNPIFTGFLDTYQWLPLINVEGVSIFGGYPEAQFRRACIGEVNPEVSCINFNPVDLPQNARSARGARTFLSQNIPVHSIGDISAAAHISVATIPEHVSLLSDLGGIETQEWSPPAIKPERKTVASPRLDAVVSGIFRVPRSEARTAISHGFITCNHRTADKRTASVSAGDQLVYRTLGRAVIEQIEENPRSKRSWVSARVYPV